KRQRRRHQNRSNHSRGPFRALWKETESKRARAASLIPDSRRHPIRSRHCAKQEETADGSPPSPHSLTANGPLRAIPERADNNAAAIGPAVGTVVVRMPPARRIAIAVLILVVFVPVTALLPLVVLPVVLVPVLLHLNDLGRPAKRADVPWKRHRRRDEAE